MDKFSMKSLIVLLFTVMCSNFGYSQTIPKSDSLGLPGDHLNLYAVFDLFQDSQTFEDFEKKLNDRDTRINNLDLNNDGKTDYIKVIDHKEGEIHSVVLQVPISESENQDVAVIEIERGKNYEINIQIIGNEDLYGNDYIIEPSENGNSQKNTSVANSAAKQEKKVIINTTTTNYNTIENEIAYKSVSDWSIMGYMYAPTYIVYSSPWYWNRYPTWWQRWKPRNWHTYYWYDRNYFNHSRNYYRRTTAYRNQDAHNFYGTRKSSSTLVLKNRNEEVYYNRYELAEKSDASKLKQDSDNPVFRLNRSQKNSQRPISIKSKCNKTK